jgi:hypothetical protein
MNLQVRPEDCATVWFARLERAKTNYDFEAAAEALQQLRRLGITVKFSPAAALVSPGSGVPA